MFFMANSSAEVIDLDLNDLAKFQRRVRFHAKLFKDLKSRFRKEYLGLLAQKRSKPISHKMKVGEIVFVENPNKKSLYWPLAKVLELLPDRDGNIRTLKLKCGNAEIIRPVQRLFPLEIQPEELPIATVGMERVPEPSTLSEVPVAYTGEEVNPELTEVNPAMDSDSVEKTKCSLFSNFKTDNTHLENLSTDLMDERSTRPFLRFVNGRPFLLFLSLDDTTTSEFFATRSTLWRESWDFYF
ncbi:DUF5641 domain-containing protein [Trichonephila clavata]|uniref:DUF5641 domain-containing protein n=1 Tax=Trichonephila clavata TaxID=2740835 RepID=A0A8X6G8G7_TRICU|nr:DUF5641 domain-containing protein [Trichonephila clavata]